jgi:hypothetical protein
MMARTSSSRGERDPTLPGADALWAVRAREEPRGRPRELPKWSPHSVLPPTSFRAAKSVHFPQSPFLVMIESRDAVEHGGGALN